MAKVFRWGQGEPKRAGVGALLSYWLSFFVLPSGPQDSLNSYLFPLVIVLAYKEKLALAPIYLGSLFAKLDQCVANNVSSLCRCDVVTHAGTSFQQIFLWKQFGALVPQLTEYPVTVPGKVLSVDGSRRTKADDVFREWVLRWFDVKHVANKSLTKVLTKRGAITWDPIRILLGGFIMLSCSRRRGKISAWRLGGLFPWRLRHCYPPCSHQNLSRRKVLQFTTSSGCFGSSTSTRAWSLSRGS